MGVINQQVLGVSDQELVKESIYPNPASRQLYINATQSVQVKVYDVLGKLVISKETIQDHSLNISSLNTGVYVITIKHEGQMSQHRFVKK